MQAVPIPPHSFAMITPSIFFAVLLVAALAVFGTYARAISPELQPEPVR